MNILLDGNLDWRLRRDLPGHSVESVPLIGWAGFKNGALLAEAEKRAHILLGLLIAIDHLDEVIALIRSSQTPDIAREGLIQKFDLTDIQARAILDLRRIDPAQRAHQRLHRLGRDRIVAFLERLLDLARELDRVGRESGLRACVSPPPEQIADWKAEPRRQFASLVEAAPPLAAPVQRDRNDEIRAAENRSAMAPQQDAQA